MSQMDRPIGYYVHHHGDGHRQRALAIAHALGGGITLLGTGLAGRTGGVPAIDLPDDRLSVPLDGHIAPRPTALHYTPTDHDGIRRRVALIADWIAEARPWLMIVDVSVEIAMLSRLASVPTVYVRLSGTREDYPHAEAFQGALALLAPFPEMLDDDDTPDWIRNKSFYAPGLTQKPCASAEPPDESMVLVVIGRGGDEADGARWAAAARAVPERQWHLIGPCSIPDALPPNLTLRGWVDDAERLIARAGVVIGAAGDGVVSAVLVHNRPFICLPEPRPFDEQIVKARRLAQLDAAVVRETWPSEDWRDLLNAASRCATRRPAGLDAADGAARVTHWLRASGPLFARATA